MNPLSSLFGLGVRARNALYDRGIARAQRLSGPVVSIGNLSVGGSGKTPFVLLLGELLKARGIKFDILSRGYGRKTRGVALVDPAGSARDFGDEPLLMARRLKVPVIVGEDRYAAGVFAENKVRTAAASARRRLPASLPRPRFRYRAGHSRRCSRPPASRRTTARTAVLASPCRCGRAHQWRFAGRFSARPEAGLEGASRHCSHQRSGQAGSVLRHRAAARISSRNCAPPASSRSRKLSIATITPTPSRTSAIC